MSDTDTIVKTVVIVMPDGAEYNCDVTKSAADKVHAVQKRMKYGWNRAFLYLLRRTSRPCYSHVRNASRVYSEKTQ